MIVKNGTRSIPVFQIKTSVENMELLEQIRNSLEIPKKIYQYKHGDHAYALLLIRDRYTLDKKLVPILDGRIVGEKSVRYELWKSELEQLRRGWKYRNIQSTANQQLDSTSKINPNKSAGIQKRPR